MFKVGDKVKIVTYGNGSNNHAHPVGRVGAVIKLDGNLIMVVIDGDDQGFDWACYASELEIAA